MGNRVAGLFVPCGHGGFADAFTKGWHHHSDGFCFRSFTADGGGLWGSSAFAYLCQERFHTDGAAFWGDDFGYGASHGAWHFNCDLIGFQLTEHFINRHEIAQFFEPCGNGGFGHRFAQSWDANFGGHGLILLT